MITNPAQMPGVVDLAIRTALARRTVAHITFPNDMQVADADEDPYAARRRRRGRRRRAPSSCRRPGCPRRRTCGARR